VLAVGGLSLALWFFTANDDATTSGPIGTVPGIAWNRPTPHAADVARGNVVLRVGSTDDTDAAMALARDLAGPDTPALRAAGQAVIVDAPRRDARGKPAVSCAGGGRVPITCPTVVAFAAGRIFTATEVGDPALRAFLDYWLGRAAG
jgi:hypothetical protein